MNRLVVHKESLPAQVGIKRRRANTAAPIASSPNSLVAEGENNDANSPPSSTEHADVNTMGSSRCETVEAHDGEAGKADPVDAVPEDEDEESSEDEDVVELERERRRIEQLQQEKQRAKDEKIGGTSAAASSTRATGLGNRTNTTNNTTSNGGVSSYNHDVLFRRREWREQNVVTTADGVKKDKKTKWEAVQNNAQHSAAFRHFMKSHFK
ncbi:hypothetical protein TraAM80_05889 [Trypanosoma rangeli]|uniref:Uncharacterized protein n=1 Tax=Trypanosoma rangeli TaxID=5698 RepID=A0A3R7RIF0_TRYRA|nr:uncharacterized protein TraAM80_05889 [Trypanosoma rangeli]RNF03209.1 hypothetical protein TraAM80_05889 [Trypanosoma rangeli]|eukprot:RNF03209.1 hypothetical protein TraAM80_05889 [Trypanosoma rangeli]